MLSEKLKVVLDTNIIISAAISSEGSPAQVFELLIDKEIENYITKEILEEVLNVINRSDFKQIISDEYRKYIIASLSSNSIMIEPKFNEKVSKHGADDKFINCALTAKAHIISGDRHLLDIKSYKGINIFSVKEFINDTVKS
jgi:uncharacterized protein